MNKELKKALVIVSISIIACMILVACKSKKVKDNEYTTINNGGLAGEISVPDELQFEITGAGKNIIGIAMSKPEFEKIYDEYERARYDKKAGKEVDEEYNYEVQVCLKKGNEIKFTAVANKNGILFTSSDKMEDGKYINQKSGISSDTWIYQKKIINLQLVYPGLVDLVNECDNYEVYFTDKIEGTKEALHDKKNNVISDKLPMKGISNNDKMLFNVEYENDNFAKITINCINFCGWEQEQILVIMGENEEKYILLKKIKSFQEIETVDVLFEDEDYIPPKGPGFYKPYYKVEMGELKYDENGKREFVPLLGESGNEFNVPTFEVSRGYYGFYVKYENIRSFFDDCSLYKGYIGENFEEMVYIVTK